jgi:serine/threonine-protein kinase HipA
MSDASIMSAVRRLEVRLDGQPLPVGVLEGLEGATYPIRFTYASGYAGPPLSAAMPPRAAPYENREARAFFDNLLPEGPQREDVRQRDGDRPVNPEDVAGLLEVVGGECPGAVSVVPAGTAPAKVPGNLDADYERLAREDVGRLLAAAAQGRNPARPLRFSLAGVQRKIALAIDPGNGDFLAPRHPGIPTTHVLKVEAAGDSRTRGIVRNELLCLRLAAAIGLPAVEAMADEIGGITTLVIRRYDRVVDGRQVHRLHQEDAAQVLGLDRTEKYEDDAARRGRRADFRVLLERVASLTVAPAETRDVLRRAAFFNWLIGNNDAHAKNFALLYAPGLRAPSLAPLYDLVAVEALPMDVHQMAMSINGTTDGDDVDRAGIEWLARLDVIRRLPGSALRLRIEGFRQIAASILPTLDALVEAGDFGRQETKPVRDVIASRIRRANGEMGWTIPATGDAPIRRPAGWALPSS